MFKAVSRIFSREFKLGADRTVVVIALRA